MEPKLRSKPHRRKVRRNAEREIRRVRGEDEAFFLQQLDYARAAVVVGLDAVQAATKLLARFTNYPEDYPAWPASWADVAAQRDTRALVTAAIAGPAYLRESAILKLFRTFGYEPPSTVRLLRRRHRE